MAFKSKNISTSKKSKIIAGDSVGSSSKDTELLFSTSTKKGVEGKGSTSINPTKNSNPTKESKTFVPDSQLKNRIKARTNKPLATEIPKDKPDLSQYKQDSKINTPDDQSQSQPKLKRRASTMHNKPSPKVEVDLSHMVVGSKTPIDIDYDQLAKKIVGYQNSKFRFTVTELPSLFFPYPPNSRVIVDSYSYREIEVLNESKLPLDMEYEFVLDGVETQGFNKYDLTFFDFQYSNLLRKIRSIENPRFSVPYYCSKCDTIQEQIFSLLEIGFDDLNLNELKDLPVNIDFNSIGTHQFIPLTVGRFLELLRKDLVYLKHNDEYVLNKQGEKIHDTSAQIAGMCISIADVEEGYNVFSQIRDPEDWELVKLVDKIFDHGISPLNFTCPNRLGEDPNQDRYNDNEKKFKYKQDSRPFCNNRISIELLGGEALLLPFHEREGASESRVSFGQT